LALVHRAGLHQSIPHHSTFSKNRHGRLQKSNLFQQLFEEIVSRCLAAGLVGGDHLSVDGSFIEANPAKESRIYPYDRNVNGGPAQWMMCTG
jgi:transposase